MEQSRKTMRHFYCRDALWETFEAMAADFDCSLDYLINESMRLYARSKNYQVTATSGSQPPASTVSGGRETGQQVAASSVSADRIKARPSTPSPVHAPPATPSTPASQVVSTGPASRERATTAMERPQVPSTNAGYPPPVQRPAPSTLPRAQLTPPPTPNPQIAASGIPPQNAPETDGAYPVLYLWFQGHRIVIDKEQFVIGRGSKNADLPLKDGNVSRQHAVILRRNGLYYIKDLGSTNGVDFKGMHVDHKRIDEGDIYHICDFELRFTYLP